MMAASIMPYANVVLLKVIIVRAWWYGGFSKRRRDGSLHVTKACLDQGGPLAMNIHFTFKKAASSTWTISVSLDGSECGVLSMGEEEAACFSEIVRQGCASLQAEFTSEGDLALREDWVLWHTRSGRERREKKDRRCGLERRRRENRRSDDRSAESDK
jgi:hypothetical protein